jgi:hypothetical protein
MMKLRAKALKKWAMELGRRMPRSFWTKRASGKKAADELLTRLATAGVNEKAT